MLMTRDLTALFEAGISVGINVDCMPCFLISGEKVCLFEICTSALKKLECMILKLKIKTLIVKRKYLHSVKARYIIITLNSFPAILCKL